MKYDKIKKDRKYERFRYQDKQPLEESQNINDKNEECVKNNTYNTTRKRK